MHLVIVTRKSPLALWQAKAVQKRLQSCYPEAGIDLLPMTSEGDVLLDRSLATVGGKGLFIRTLEKALLEGKADMAVHSLKDMPARLDPRFTLATFLKREDPSDAWVSNSSGPLALAKGVVGTSSLRRKSLLNRYAPHLQVELLRGNVESRLKKLDAKAFDALILASAGLKRLGLSERIAATLPKETFVPAPGQGIMAIETLSARLDLQEILAPLDDANARICALAEREVGAALGLDCSAPFGAYAEIDGDVLSLRAFVASEDGAMISDAFLQGSIQAPFELANRCAEWLRHKGHTFSR
jgi:hydroxymethylbilane synthase